MTAGFEQVDTRESIQRIYEGEPAPEGMRIVRLLQVVIEPYGTGTMSRRVYTVVCERAKP